MERSIQLELLREKWNAFRGFARISFLTPCENHSTNCFST